MERIELNPNTVNALFSRYKDKDCKQGQTGYVFKMDSTYCFKIISDFFDDLKEQRPVILTPQREKFTTLVESFDSIRNDLSVDLPLGLLTYNGVPIGDYQKYHKGYKTLQKVIKNQDLNPSKKIIVFEYLLNLLKEFEKVGFIYEDFHWKNVLLKVNRVKLIDFDDTNFNGIKPSNVCISYERFLMFIAAVSENDILREEIESYIDIPGINSRKYTQTVCEDVISMYKRLAK